MWGGIYSWHHKDDALPSVKAHRLAVNSRLTSLCLASVLLGATACQHTDEGSETRPTGVNVLSAEELDRAEKGRVDFTAHVKPILAAKCVACHHSEALPGRLNLESRAAARRSGALGAFIVPGDPERSLFLSKLDEAHVNLQAMPPVGETLTAEEIRVLRRWIAQGAPWPEGRAGQLTAPHAD